jgi:hypothetical protein
MESFPPIFFHKKLYYFISGRKITAEQLSERAGQRWGCIAAYYMLANGKQQAVLVT